MPAALEQRMDIHGKTVLITGASEGIGAACAASFRRRGARLSLVARSEDKLRRIAAEGELITVGDLTDAGVRQTCVERTVERFGSLDILINNAGVGLYVPAHRATTDQVRRLAELNLFVPLELIQLAVPHMERRGGGFIVNVGSIGGKVTLPWMTLYSVTKYALGSLTNGLRIELRAKGIQCMVVCPGYVKTGFQGNVIGGRVPPAVERGRRFGITAGECAEAMARGVEKNKRTVMAPPVGWVLVGLSRLFPAIVDWQMHRMYRSLE